MNKLLIGLTMIGCAGLAHPQQSDTVFGDNAFIHNTTGSDDSVFGADAMFYNTTGSYNTAVGHEALVSNRVGGNNTAVGMYSLMNNTAFYNTALGFQALSGNSTGQYNIGVGFFSGYASSTGSNNIEIGNMGLVKDNGVIRIGTQGTQTFTQIAGIYESKVVGGRAVVIDSKGHLGYAVTKVVPNVASAASVADVVSLRAEIATLRTQLNVLRSELAHHTTH